ncbi:tail tubular protein A [Vibrio phage vB_VpaP_G1]|uniref:Tail tubular protein A n=1 Tax=Vibrio phage vB_VpaP_G1 TaxID=2862773 RepID=A0AAE7WW83_9CAUD|nr:tail protein [Vibrio phage vB_VpaP_G1]QYW05827.1 tail tubular protein A [Vibrio phage vB_VpaP_G1]
MRDTLNVVNSCLASIGESPLLELTDDHPLEAVAVDTLNRVMTQEMARQWWFNTDFLTLQVANDKYIYAPQDAVAFIPATRKDLTLRGRRLYNRFTGTYEMTENVQGWVVRLLPFEDLPMPAQSYVEAVTVVTFQTNYDADPNKTSELKQHRADSWMVLNAEHIRQIKANPLLSPELAQKRLRIQTGYGGHIPVR